MPDDDSTSATQSEDEDEGATVAAVLSCFRISPAALPQASRFLRKDLDPKGPEKQLDLQPDGMRHKRLEGFDPQAVACF